MHIKRFEGSDMRDVLRRVREELGPDALVLSTRNLRRRGRLFGAFGRSVVEVTAAVDREARKAAQPQGAEERAQAASANAGPDASWNELRITRALVSPLEAEIQELREAIERLHHSPEASATSRLTEELDALRRVALDLRSARAPQGPRGEAPFRRAGLDGRHASRLAAAVEDGSQAVPALARLLDEKLRPPRPDEDAVTLYVGPTGVGKTTTLAKVAGWTRDSRDDLAVFSTDVHRVAADAPLRAWSRNNGIDFETATSPSEFATAIARLGRRPVLVDTAGRNRQDEIGMRELVQLRDALGERARVCLVLPATRKEADLHADVARFGALAPEAMAVTRIDESSDLGNVANLLLDGSCPPLHWLAAGQRVPDDLEVADPHDLAERILGAAA